MKKKLSVNISKVLLTAAMLIGLASCASSTPEMDENTDLRAMVQEAAQLSRRAMEVAQSAEDKADEAMQKAEDAQACCDANTQRMDRMFQTLQQK